ncbi:MAG: agmatine deiminase family protein [Bryobacteraceae bacterium]
MSSATGFRMPAEWERHAATWIAWPHETTDWPGKFHPVAWVYGEFARCVTQVERLRVLVRGEADEQRARLAFRKSGANRDAIDFYHHPTNRSWTRDFCPIFVKNDAGEVAATDWIFNGWAKYANWEHDNAIPAFVASALSVRRFSAPFVLEGGSIEVNGAGLLMTTEECLLSPVQQRNPGKSREDIEGVLRDYLGIRDVIWLGNGITGDDTHGHVDDLARFTSVDTVVTVVEDDPADPNYEPLQENLRRLQERRDLRVRTLPMPKPVYFDGQRLPASYANFYIANGIVLVPTFNDPNDRVALNTLAELFPERTVTGIHCVDLVLGLGTLHCMTQQQPA